MISSAGRLPKPPRAPYPDDPNTALSRSVRNLFQMGSDMIGSLSSLDRSSIPAGRSSQARAHAFDETHVDDLFVFDVGLEDTRLAHHGAAGRPGFLADHAVLAPQLVLERAV